MGNTVSCVAEETLPNDQTSPPDSLTPIGSPECVSVATSEEPSLVQQPPFTIGGRDDAAMALWAKGTPDDLDAPIPPAGCPLDYSPSSSSVGDWDDADFSEDTNGQLYEQDLMDLPFPLGSHPEPEHTVATAETSSVLNGSEFASLMGLIKDGDDKSVAAAGDQRIAFQRVVADGTDVDEQPQHVDESQHNKTQKAAPARDTIDVTRPCPQHLYVRYQLAEVNNTSGE